MTILYCNALLLKEVYRIQSFNWPVLAQGALFLLSQLDPFRLVLQLQDFPETEKLKNHFLSCIVNENVSYFWTF